MSSYLCHYIEDVFDFENPGYEEAFYSKYPHLVEAVIRELCEKQLLECNECQRVINDFCMEWIPYPRLVVTSHRGHEKLGFDDVICRRPLFRNAMRCLC